MLEIRVIRIAVLCGHLMALFLFMGNLGHRFPILLFIFIILKPKEAEGEFLCHQLFMLWEG